jgi:hypothetical protein
MQQARIPENAQGDDRRETIGVPADAAIPVPLLRLF